MLTKRNIAIIILAAVLSGAMGSTIFGGWLLGAILGALMAVVLWCFNTWSTDSTVKWTTTESCFNLGLALVNLLALIFEARYPNLGLFTNAFAGAFIGTLVVNVLIVVFGPRRR